MPGWASRLNWRGKVVKTHAFRGQAVDRRSLGEVLKIGSIGGNGLEGMIVYKHDHEVRLGFTGESEQRNQKEGQKRSHRAVFQLVEAKKRLGRLGK